MQVDAVFRFCKMRSYSQSTSSGPAQLRKDASC